MWLLTVFNISFCKIRQKILVIVWNFFPLCHILLLRDLLYKNDFKNIFNLLCHIHYRELSVSGHAFKHRLTYFKQHLTEILAPLKDLLILVIIAFTLF